jgi:hypothetical protein
MNSFSNTKPSPIEVWLRQQNMQITCMVVREDETTYELGVDSLSMRGAQREMTGWLIKEGYEPIGRWQVESDDETWRRFKLLSAQESMARMAEQAVRRTP